MQLDPDCAFEEKLIKDARSGDAYTGLTVVAGTSLLDIGLLEDASPAIPARFLHSVSRAGKVLPKFHLIPYFARANRGGRGQMRVGFKKWVR